MVGFYGGAERIHRLAISPFGPIGQAFYPHMVRAAQSNMDVARRTAQRMLLLLFIIGLLISATLMIGAHLLSRLCLGLDTKNLSFFCVCFRFRCRSLRSVAYWVFSGLSHAEKMRSLMQ